MSTAFRLLLPRRLLDEMLMQAVAELPNECCGFLAGHVDAAAGVARVSHRFPLVNAAASPIEYWSEERSLFEADLEGTIGFVIGGEGAGVSPQLLDLAAERVRIPMAEGIESLNAAAAATLVFYEWRRQREKPHHPRPSADPSS